MSEPKTSLKQKMLNILGIKKVYEEKNDSIKKKIKDVKFRIEKKKKDTKIAETLDLISKL